MQNASMAVQITIRDVPNPVRDELAARAALEGKSMQEYLHAQLLRIVEKPSMQLWMANLNQRVEDADREISAVEILQARDADRK